MGWHGDDEDDGVKVEHDGLVHETDAAQLYEIDGDKVWIPKSVILDENDGGDFILVKSWWAEKEGLA
jgi:hypothetical protein